MEISPIVGFTSPQPRGTVLPAHTRFIKENDTIIIYQNKDNMSVEKVVDGEYFQSRQGVFEMGRFIGLPFGSLVYADKQSGGGRHRKKKAVSVPVDGEEKQPVPEQSKRLNKKGWVVLLAPTPELWTLALTHRTQILYSADISLILLYLELRPGAVVIESGTGSGSLSTAIVRTVAPTGKLHTFEFNENRVAAARRDFARLQIDSLVTVTHRNVVRDGLPVIDGLVDAVVLDLPLPWDVLDSVYKTLKENGRFCGFSPCIEQVQKTVAALHKYGFTDIRVVECLAKDIECRKEIVYTPAFCEEDLAHSVEKKKQKNRRVPHALQTEEIESGDVTFVSQAFPEMKGHSGFLTFGRKPVQ